MAWDSFWMLDVVGFNLPTSLLEIDNMYLFKLFNQIPWLSDQSKIDLTSLPLVEAQLFTMTFWLSPSVACFVLIPDRMDVADAAESVTKWSTENV